MKNENFGVHLMFDGYKANKERLYDKEKLLTLLTEVPTQMGMHTICEPQIVTVGPKNKKDAGGVSGFVMIAESHISFHTFPESGFVTADIYTCQNDLDTKKFTEILAEIFDTTDYDVQIADRGVRFETAIL